jgi:branched-chain amino acid transport system substrate-binding protein
MANAKRWAGLALAAGLTMVGAGAAHAQEHVTIGFTGPLSGGAALYGKNTLTGLQDAASEINAAGGLTVGGAKYLLDIVALDDKYNPSEAAVNAKRLRAQYKAPVVFVPHAGGVLALQAFNEQDGFLIGAYTSTPAVTEHGNGLTFRIPPSFDGYVHPFVQVEMKRFGKKLGMAGGDHDYAKAWAALIGPDWTKAGGEIVADNQMSYNKDTDFYSGVSRVLAGNPNVLFVGGASEPTALVMKQARELGFEGGFVVMDQAKFDEMAKVVGGYEPLEGAVGVMPLASDPRPGAAGYIASFRKKHGEDPGSEAGLNYSALYGVAGAMEAAGSVTDAKAIRAKLDEVFAKLPTDHDPVHIVGVDAKGGSKIDFVLAMVDHGKLVAIDPGKL